MKNRLICQCYNIYTKDIEEEIKNGTGTYKDLVDKTRIGIMCSACCRDAENVFNTLKEQYEKHK